MFDHLSGKLQEAFAKLKKRKTYRSRYQNRRQRNQAGFVGSRRKLSSG